MQSDFSDAAGGRRAAGVLRQPLQVQCFRAPPPSDHVLRLLKAGETAWQAPLVPRKCFSCVRPLVVSKQRLGHIFCAAVSDKGWIRCFEVPRSLRLGRECERIADLKRSSARIGGELGPVLASFDWAQSVVKLPSDGCQQCWLNAACIFALAPRCALNTYIL